jgi:hypothetical protein
VWAPTTSLGIVTVTLKVPRPLTFAKGRPSGLLSQVSWTRVLGEKVDPVTVTEVPAGPEAGESEIVGVSSAAKLADNGRRRAPATMTIVAVAITSRQRDLRRGGVGVFSEIQ